MVTIKFVLTEEDFLFLEKTILDMGYEEITTKDSSKTFTRLKLSPPRPIFGREASYVYRSKDPANNYAAILRTTYLKAQKKWRDTGTDIGWVLIVEGDKEKYFARPFQRSKGFILKFLRYAWVSKFKVDNRPLCPDCNAYMHLKRKTGTRQYFWACFNNERHPFKTASFKSWDFNLKENALNFVNIRREFTKKYNARNKKLGKIVTPAAVKRKKWPIGNKENLV